jgi:hypothetical protein
MRILLTFLTILLSKHSFAAAAGAGIEDAALLDGKEFIECDKGVVLLPVRHYRLAEEDKYKFSREALISPYEDKVTGSNTFFHEIRGNLIVSIFCEDSSNNPDDHLFSTIFPEKILPKVPFFDSDKSIFFIGVDRGASLAAIAASEFIKKRSEEYKGKNIVKVIGVGITELPETQISSIHETIGRKNILSFFPSQAFSTKGLYNLFSTPIPKIGVPIMILPSEQMVDNLPRVYYSSLEVASLASGAISAVFAGTAFANPHSPHASVISASAATAAVLSRVVVDFSVRPIPSDTVITKALEYTQRNILLNESDGYDIEAVGVPPLLSSRRGVGGWFHGFLT